MAGAFGGGSTTPKKTTTTTRTPPSGGYFGGPAPIPHYSDAAPGGNYPVAPVAGAPAGAGSVALATTADPNLTGLTDYATTQMSQPDPLLQEAIQTFRNRMSTDTTQRAIGKTAGAIDDALAGALQRTKEEASITGMSSGTEAQRSAGLTDAAQRAKAGAAADITLGREQDLDRLAGGFASAASLPGQRQLNWFGAGASVAGQKAGNQLAGQSNQISMAQLLQQQAQAQQAAMLNAYNLAYA